jgi:nitrite reductase/ring-hydroxylating ferredoxin subunit
LLAVPAVATGLSDWADTSDAERRIGFVHLSANLAATTLYLASWRARRRGAYAHGVAYGLAGAASAGAAGWLGGHLAYALGLGVDTTAFDGGPTEWTLVTRDAQNPHAGSAAGVPLLIVEDDHGVHVLADRCTHRGGPLSEGTIEQDCVRCPWHGSRFSLVTGRVEDGPAVAPQPVYEVRIDEGSLYVRRSEPRGLRVNPTRAR